MTGDCDDLVPSLPQCPVRHTLGYALPVEGSVTLTGEMIGECRDHGIEIGRDNDLTAFNKCGMTLCAIW